MIRRIVHGAVAATLMVALVGTATAPVLAYTPAQQQEIQIGQQVYQQLQQKGEIIRNSPYYNTLNPIAARIKSVADAQYFVPFHFILVHEPSPNAFAVPGGNVYVTDTMMTFVQNKEELAGVLCHETSHDIHHDVVNNMAKDQRLSIYAGIADILLGRNSALAGTAINLLANLQALTFSREVEHNADHKGAITCAQAGLNPWGMIWLFNHFERAPHGGTPPEALSDHPRDDHRISDLETEFAASPSLFSKYNPDQCSATPIGFPGFRSQTGRGCSSVRQQSQTPIRRSPNAGPTCPPGWKYCHRRR